MNIYTTPFILIALSFHEVTTTKYLQSNTIGREIRLKDLTPLTKHKNATMANSKVEKKMTWPSSKRNGRQLGEEDFGKLNDIFEGLVFTIPDIEFRQELGGIWGSALIGITDMRCSGIYIEDAKASYEIQNNRNIIYNLVLMGIDFNCYFQYSIDYGFNNKGRAYINVEDSSVSTAIKFSSNDLRYYPPEDTFTEECVPIFNIQDMDFKGGLTGWLANAFEKLARDPIEDEIKKVLCEEISSFGSNEFEDLIVFMSNYVSSYFGDIPEEDMNPFSGQEKLLTPEDDKLFDLQNSNDQAGNFIRDGFDNFFSSLGDLALDETSSEQDLKINIMLRNNILDSKGTYTISANERNWNIYDGHDAVSESVVAIRDIRIKGLDSLTRFDSMNAIGPQTLKNHVIWKFLEFDVDLSVTMRASTLKNSFIVETGVAEVVSDLTVAFKVEDIAATISFLSAFSRNRFGEIQLGSLFENIPSCILSSHYDIEVTEFHLTTGFYQEPSLEGFIAPGLDELISNTVEALNSMYEGSIMKATPKFFATEVKKILNDILSDILEDESNLDCPTIQVDQNENKRVNLQSLLSGADMKNDDGSIYTELSKITKPIIKELEQPDAINAMIIEPLTLYQSHEEGVIKQQIALPFNKMNVIKFDIRLENLDSFDMPKQIMDPDSLNPYLFHNQVALGVKNNPVYAKIQFDLPLETTGASLMENKMEVTLEMSNVELSSSIEVQMNEKAFLEYPLRDLSNPFCWLALIPTPALDERGLAKANFEPYLAIQEFDFSYVQNIDLELNCISCSSRGMGELPVMVGMLRSSGIVKAILYRLIALSEEIMESSSTELALARLVSHASYQCPHDPLYMNAKTSYEPLPLPKLSYESLDSIVLAAGVTSQLALITASMLMTESNENTSSKEIDESSLENAVNLSMFEKMIQTWVKPMFEDIVTDESGVNKKEPQINQVLRSLVLNNDGIFILPSPFSAAFNFLGYDVELLEIRVKGLDSFASLNFLNFVSKYVIENRAKIESLDIEVDMKINREEMAETTSRDESNALTFIVSLSNIDMALSVFLAFTNDDIKNLQLGSMLNIDKILPCVLSIAQHLDITDFQLNVENIDYVQLDGFVSQETKTMFSDSSRLLMNTYKEDVLSALEVYARKSLTALIDMYKERSSCDFSGTQATSMYLNLHELFSPLDETNQNDFTAYGNIIPRLMSIVENLIYEPAGINNKIIEPLTIYQSNEIGTIVRPGEIIDFTFGHASINLYDLKIDNLNSFDTPQQFFGTEINSPYVLENHVAFGVGSNNPVRGSFVVSIMTDEDDSKKSFENKLEITVELSTVEILSSILIKISEQNFLNFSLMDLSNPSCWANFFFRSELNDRGNPIANLFTPYLAVEDFSFSNEALMDVSVDCVSCESQGVEELPSMIDVLRKSVDISDLSKSFFNTMEEVLKSRTMEVALARVLNQRRQLCVDNEYRNNHKIDVGGNSFTIPIVYDPLPLPILSTDSWDFALLSAGILSEMTLAVMSLNRFGGENINVEQFTHNFETSNIFDFMTIKPMIEKFVKPTLEKIVIVNNKDLTAATDIITKLQESSHEEKERMEQEEIIGINEILRSFLLNELGQYKIDFLEKDDKALSFDLSDLGINLRVAEIRIKGLDSVRDINILDIVSSYEIQNRILLQHVTVEVDVLIIGIPIQLPAVSSENNNDDGVLSSKLITLAVEMSDVDLSLTLALAFDSEAFGEIQLGSLLLHPEQILSCIFTKTARFVDVTSLQMDIGDDVRVEIQQGFYNEEHKKSFSDFSRSIIDRYKSRILSGLSMFGRTQFVDVFQRYTSSSCNDDDWQVVMEPGNFVDFNDLLLDHTGENNSQYGDLVGIAYNLFEDHVLSLDENTGQLKLNHIINDLLPYTQYSSGVNDLYFPDRLVDINENDFEFILSDLRIENLNSFGRPLTVMHPSKDHVLENEITLGHKETMHVSFKVFVALEGYDVMNELDVSMLFNNTSIFLPLLAKVDSKTLFEFPLRHLTNPYCWLATIPAPPKNESDGSYQLLHGYGDGGMTLAVDSFGLEYDDIEISVDCIKCTHPDLIKLSLLTNLFDDPSKISEGISDFVTSKFVQDKIIQTQYDALERCAFHAVYVPQIAQMDEINGTSTGSSPFMQFTGLNLIDNSYKKAFGIVGIVLSWIIVVTLSSFRAKVARYLNHKKWIRQAANTDILTAYKKQIKEKEDEAELCKVTLSMVRSKNTIPLLVRILYPHIVLINIGLFAMGHLSLGASVDIMGEIIGETLKMPQFFTFSMAQSTWDLWEANAKALAVIIVIFSGLWPYFKQLLTLVLWFLPPSKISVTTRGNIFIWLDVLAKWSMMDIYVLITTVVSFRLTIKNPNLLPENFYSVELLVVPLWGLYANMIAQVISQFTSHVIIYYQRQVVNHGKKIMHERKNPMSILDTHINEQNKKAEEDFKNDDVSSFSSISSPFQKNVSETFQYCDNNDDDANTQVDTVYNHHFELSNRQNRQTAQIRHGVNTLLIVVAMVAILLLYLGCFLPSLKLEILGLLGLLVEAGDNFKHDAKSEHSMFTIVRLIMDEARFLDLPHQYLGLGSLSVLLVFTSVVVPTMLVATLLIIWFRPMTKRRRESLLHWVDILKAWQYVEVYVISILITTWQLGQISTFMFNDEYCKDFDKQFSMLSYYGFVKSDDAQCFYNKASIGIGAYLLTISAVMIAWLSSFIVEATLQKHEDDYGNMRWKHGQMSKTIPLRKEDIANTTRSDVIKSVRSPPVRFSDSFFGFLRPTTITSTIMNTSPKRISRSSSFSVLNREISVSTPPTSPDTVVYDIGNSRSHDSLSYTDDGKTGHSQSWVSSVSDGEDLDSDARLDVSPSQDFVDEVSLYYKRGNSFGKTKTKGERQNDSKDNDHLLDEDDSLAIQEMLENGIIASKERTVS